MKKSKKLYAMIALLLLCVTVNILGVNQTMAWFVSGGLIGTGDYSTARVQYLPTLEPNETEKGKYGSLIKGSTDTEIVFLIPGDSIIAKFGTENGHLTLENFSTVNSEVRTVIDCNFIESVTNTDGTKTDTITSMTGFEWKLMGGDIYQFGKKHIAADGKEIFMGLLEVAFANKAVKDTTYPGYIPPPDDSASNAKYSWEFVNNTNTFNANMVDFSNAWNLVLSDTNTIIPPPNTDSEQKGRAYNVITDMKIVGESQKTEDQGVFDAYFSENYAGKRIRIAVKYYAKQTMGMEWNLFSEELLTMKTPDTPTP